MSPSEDDLVDRVKYLEKYTNTLHMILDNFVQRVRKVEAATGLDEEGIDQSLEWRSKLEFTLVKMMLEQDWEWQDSDDTLDREIGDVSYENILRISEMLPTDVVMQCWAKVQEKIPSDLPLVWSDGSPTNDQVSDRIKDDTDQNLVKMVKQVTKYDYR